MNNRWATAKSKLIQLAPLGLVALVVVLGNSLFLTGITSANPISWTAHIARVTCAFTCGRPMIDPNVGFITQALGHRAALDLFHGHIAWWNVFEGLGQPLVGEMQAAALFPLTLFFAFANGLLWFHLGLELIAGFSTYFLVRRLRFSTEVAVLVGSLFALNGTFAWVGNAVLNPVAFLPLLLLGVEMLLDSEFAERRVPWLLLSFAVAGSLYAGFPEVAYLDILFALLWWVLRIGNVQREYRKQTVFHLATGLGVGTLFSLPVLVPFLDFMRVANIGHHANGLDAGAHVNPHGFAMLFDPYIYGTLNSNSAVTALWGGIGGFITVTVLFLALVGVTATGHRRLRFGLAGWVFFSVLGMFNIAGVRSLWNLVPLLSQASLARYITPTVELAFLLLAAFGVQQLSQDNIAKKRTIRAGIISLVVLLVGQFSASKLNAHYHLRGVSHLVFLALELAPYVALGIITVGSTFVRGKWRFWLLALVVLGESLTYFMVPTAEAPSSISVDQAPISYLLQHQGNYRFVDLGVLAPNWGSYYGLNELTAIDLPIPKSFTTYIQTSLYTGLTPSNQFTVHDESASIVAFEGQIAQHFANYEQLGVKYLLMPSSLSVSPALSSLGVTQVFHDSLTRIFQLPNPTNFYSGCRIVSSSASSVSARCSPGAILVRSELAMTGWHVSVNGRVEQFVPGQLLQEIKLPKGGLVTVHYWFFPPFEWLALVSCLLSVLFMIEESLRLRLRRKSTQ